MSEGYALFDKVVSVLENANNGGGVLLNRSPRKAVAV